MVLSSQAHVAVSAGLAERVAAIEHAWSGEQPFLLRPREAVVGSRHVAHRRESTAERLSHDLGALCVDVRGRIPLELAEVRAESGEVHVSVDESRHHHQATRVDPIRVAHIQIRTDLDDDAIFDPDIHRAGQAGHDVEDRAAGDDGGGLAVGSVRQNGLQDVCSISPEE